VDNVNVCLLDAAEASVGPRIARTFAWRVLGRRPLRLKTFSNKVVAECRRTHPQVLLTTGLAPVTAEALRSIGGNGLRRVNFLTDDPWNPVHYASWFFRALPEYDVVFTPRRANINDLRQAGCRRVEYLPFGYDPRLFYPDQSSDEPSADLLFVGGGDDDRGELLSEVARAKIEIVIYGSYWEKYPDLRTGLRGQVGPDVLRRATSNAKVNLILVRRANRDGHVMRTFEAAACGGCLLVEETQEHRDLFGPDGECVVYFRTSDELIDRARRLIADEPTRKRLSQAVLHRVTTGRHTYADRLRTMLEV
jgi:spore maturation protein CgeB